MRQIYLLLSLVVIVALIPSKPNLVTAAPIRIHIPSYMIGCFDATLVERLRYKRTVTNPARLQKEIFSYCGDLLKKNTKPTPDSKVKRTTLRSPGVKRLLRK